MKAEQFKTYTTQLHGFKVNVTTYKIGDEFICVIDNYEPGGQIARSQAPTKEKAIEEALKEADAKLSKSRRF